MLLASDTNPRAKNTSDGDLLQVSDARILRCVIRLIIHIVMAVNRLCDLIRLEFEDNGSAASSQKQRISRRRRQGQTTPRAEDCQLRWRICVTPLVATIQYPRRRQCRRRRAARRGCDLARRIGSTNIISRNVLV